MLFEYSMFPRPSSSLSSMPVTSENVVFDASPPKVSNSVQVLLAELHDAKHGVLPPQIGLHKTPPANMSLSFKALKYIKIDLK